jgi:hypothetical protein
LIKRGLIALAALVALVSGISAVSAFEAHAINVTAHVENALQAPAVLIYGTVFPEEWHLKRFQVQVSESFCDPTQDRHDFVFYQVWLLEKPDPDNDSGGEDTGFYPWLGDAMYLRVDQTAPDITTLLAADLTHAGYDDPPILLELFNTNTGLFSTTQSLNKEPPRNRIDQITVAIDVPVFEGFYNRLTDVPVKQSGESVPTVIIQDPDDDVDNNDRDDLRYFPDGEDEFGSTIILGADIVLQVVGFGSPSADGSGCED